MIRIISLGIMIASLVMSVDIYAGFDEKMIAISVPQMVGPAPLVAASIAKVITAGELSLFTVAKQVLLPAGGAPIFVAPYYYAAQVTWYNTDGAVRQINGNSITMLAFLGIKYDVVSKTWIDISGIGIASDGVTRIWPYGDNYLSCSNSAGSSMMLQAFMPGSVGSTIAYGTVEIGAANIPVPYVISPFDLDILRYPNLFFVSTGECNPTIVEVSANGYSAPNPVSTNTTIQNTVAAMTLPNGTPSVAVVTFNITGSAATESYSLPKSSIIKVMNKIPISNQGSPLMVRQSFINSLTNGAVTVGVSSPVAQPFKTFVTSSLNMQLADYYLKIPVPAIAGAVVGNAVCIALLLTSSGTFVPVPGITLSADKTQVLISSSTYFDSALNSSGQMYINNFASTMPLATVQANQVTYVRLLGSSKKEDIAARAPLYTAMQSARLAEGSIIAASEQFFRGQCIFHTRACDQINSLTQAQLVQNPLVTIALGESSFYANNGVAMKAVLETGLLTDALKKKWQNGDAIGALIQMKFMTSDQATDFDGVIVMKSGVINSPPAYYRTDLASSLIQLWYASATGDVLQLANDFSGSSMLSVAIASDAQVGLLATDRSSLLDTFNAKAASIWGLKPRVAGSSGLSTLQSNQIGLGVGMGALGVAALGLAYKLKKAHDDD